MWSRLLHSHVFSNLVFALILCGGIWVYLSLPREQDPAINFNWVQITTLLPGASAEDIERKVTDPLEEALEKIKDVKFVSSNSRDNVSTILVRFQEISDSTFDKRVADLRREVQTIERDLPDAAKSPLITELTTDNALPIATLALTGQADDEHLRRLARRLKRDLARVPGVDQIVTAGLRDPELHVRFHPEKLAAANVGPDTLVTTVGAYFQDVALGSARIAETLWRLRLDGASSDPGYLAALPLTQIMSDSAASGDVLRIEQVAETAWAREKSEKLVRYRDQPAVLFSVTKRAGTNTLQLVERLQRFIARYNAVTARQGVALTLIDDQTLMTRTAIDVMQTNALYGLLLVMLLSGLFLGRRIAFLVSIGIPFILAGTFIVLKPLGHTLNISVLLGIVIALGMLVDDAVVVVEAIFERLRRGIATVAAVQQGLREVFAPVTASVLTTMAAFLPLLLLPGILGKFMRVIPTVVCCALAISLLEAYWMLPNHVIAMKLNFDRPSRWHRWRMRALHTLRVYYGYALIATLRRPKRTLAVLLCVFASAVALVVSGRVEFNFFTFDPMRFFYVNVDMPPTATLDETINVTKRAEHLVRQTLRAEELRDAVSYAGQKFTETEPLFGEGYGQVLVSLQPHHEGMRGVTEMIDAIRPDLERLPGPLNVSILKMSGGPPKGKAINVKIRGDDYPELRAATDALLRFMRAEPGFQDIADDDTPGRHGLVLRLRGEAIQRAGLSPQTVQQALLTMTDGVVAAQLRDSGDLIDVRVLSTAAYADRYQHWPQVLDLTLPLPQGGRIPLRELVDAETTLIKSNLRHYNFRRTITIEADIDDARWDTLAANQAIRKAWEAMARDYPNVSLDFTGELDDINESLRSIAVLFAVGVGLIYLILSTQFNSYFQPLLILVTVPMAFTGVAYGLWLTGNPLSLFTLYGVVALTGIAVNASIVLISATNDNLLRGMSVLHAVFYAARRRLLPIIVTTLTTVGGLLSLALGWGGQSLLWGPVATAIVYGLMVSSLMTLFVVPSLFLLTHRRR